MSKSVLIRPLRFCQEVFFRGAASLTPGLPVGIASRPCGFFSNYFITLNGLRFCDSIGAVGVPVWDRACLYLEGPGCGNLWNALFHSPEYGGRSVGPWSMLPRYYASASAMTAYRAPSPRLAAHRLMRRFAEPHDVFLGECEAFVREQFGGRPAVAVHVRGTDARRGCEDRVGVSYEHLHAEVAEGLRRRDDAVLFVATDEAPLLDMMRDRYGDRVRFRPCVRSSDGRSIHGHHDAGVRSSGFEKARDVLLDALVMSRCDYLIRTHSAVTAYTLCRNPDLPYVDLEVKYLNIVRQPWLHEKPRRSPGAAT